MDSTVGPSPSKEINQTDKNMLKKKNSVEARKVVGGTMGQWRPRGHPCVTCDPAT